MKKLKELRGDKTQTEVANALNLARATYGTYESGTRQPDHDTLCRLADYYGVSVDYILGRESKPRNGVSNIIAAGAQVRIPILGSIRAGKPILASEHVEGYENADVRFAEGHFYLLVEGDSMEPTIPHNALVLIRHQPYADPNQIVACLVDGDFATLKRYKPQPNGIILLQADNPNAKSYTVTPEEFANEYAMILGVAVEAKYKL